MLLHQKILVEAKSVRDFRHKDIRNEFPGFFGPIPGHRIIDPSDGFFFAYDKGNLILSSSNNINYSALATSGLWKELKTSKTMSSDREIDRRALNPNQLPEIDGKTALKWVNGEVSFADSTVKFETDPRLKYKDPVAKFYVNNIKELQSILKNLLTHGVNKFFTVINLDDALDGSTIEDLLKLKDPATEISAKNNGHILYHGTSFSRWEKHIQKEGLRPGNVGKIYNDLIPGYSEHNIYLGTTPRVSDFYGKRQAEKDGDDFYVILKITLPDTSKLKPDDLLYLKYDDYRTLFKKTKRSIREISSVAYKGIIRPKFIELLSKKKVGDK